MDDAIRRRNERRKSQLPMRIGDLIETLTEQVALHGNIPVCVSSEFLGQPHVYAGLKPGGMGADDRVLIISTR